MAPRRGRALAAPIVFQPRDESVHRFAPTFSRASSVGPYNPQLSSRAPDQRERSRSAPAKQRQGKELLQARNPSEMSSRASSLGAAVGFLLSRARQQKMTSQSSKRSRSSSAIYSRQQSENRDNYRESLASSTAANLGYHANSTNERHQSQQRRPQQHNYQQSQQKCENLPAGGHERDSSQGAPKSLRRERQDYHAKDGSSMFTGLASIPPDPTTRTERDEAPSSASSAPVMMNARVQPVWVLIGTFKTTMDNIVRVSGGSLLWHQRNPKGGFQSMQIALSLITEVSCARVAVASDVAPTFSVIIKTAGKPSQVTFGFKNVNDATGFKTTLVQIIRSISI